MYGPDQKKESGRVMNVRAGSGESQFYSILFPLPLGFWTIGTSEFFPSSQFRRK